MILRDLLIQSLISHSTFLGVAIAVICYCLSVCAYFVPSMAVSFSPSSQSSLRYSPPCFPMTLWMYYAANLNEPMLTLLGGSHVQRPEALISDTGSSLKALLVAPVVGWTYCKPVLYLLLFKLFQSARIHLCLSMSVHDFRMSEI